MWNPGRHSTQPVCFTVQVQPVERFVATRGGGVVLVTGDFNLAPPADGGFFLGRHTVL